MKLLPVMRTEDAVLLPADDAKTRQDLLAEPVRRGKKITTLHHLTTHPNNPDCSVSPSPSQERN